MFSMYGVPDNYIYVYSTYVDSVLGLLWGMSVILYLSNRNRTESLLITGLVLFPMVQIKDTGMFFALSTMLVVSIDRIFFQTIGLPVKLKQIGTLVAVVMVSWASWSMFKQHNEIEPARYSNLLASVAESIEELMMEPQNYKRKVAANWLRSMAHVGDVQKTRENLREAESNYIEGFGPTFALSNFSLSPLYWMVIWMGFVFSISTGRTFETRDVFLTTMITLALLVLVYSCLILFLYMSYFSK